MFYCRKILVCYRLFAALLLLAILPGVANAQSGLASGDSKKSFSKYTTVRNAVNNNTVTIVLGVDSDTQIHIAKDMMEILNNKAGKSRSKLRVLPMLSDGGAQNALDIMFLRGVDLGIMQTDTLAHLRGANRKLYKDVFNRVHYIAKLYNAEWHVIGRKGITNIRQLKGKKVNISKPGSGSYITSQNIFELLGVRAKYSTYDNTLALQKLRTGELDAVVWMGGAPLNGVQSIGPDEGFHIIPATFLFDSYFETPLRNVLEDFYLPTHLTHEHYPNLIEPGQKIPTIANGVVLAVYNWSLSKNVFRRQKVQTFVQEFIKRFKLFKADGRHPKWREVNLFANIPEWKRSNIAKRILARSANTIQKSENKEFEMFVQFLQRSGREDLSNLSEQEKRNLYGQFLGFAKTR